MKLFKNITWMMLLCTFLYSSCKKEKYTLDPLPDASQLKFDVRQDLAADPGGNTIILTNLTPETVPMWDYGTGKSNRQVDTIRFAFAGTYTIKYSALTGGGIVEMPPVTVTVTKDNLNYVNDPLWTALSGGVGKEKTWYLDLDANGVSKYFDGPLYFYGTNMGWGGTCMPGGTDCWNWNPGWSGNTWLMNKADFGSLTFSLKGGPFVTAKHLTIPGRGTENGTYFLDKDNKTLTLTDATPLHDIGRDPCVAQWGNIRLLSLTENTMQFAVLRTSCEGPCLLVYNFISKDYNDNWTPPPPPVPKPDEGYNPVFAPGELLTMLTGGSASGRFWSLDGAGNPVDWVAKGNGWTTSKASSYNWGWNESWDAVAAEGWIKFDNNGGQHYSRFQNGVVTTGNFTINEATNEINLGTNTLLQNSASWMSPSANTIKVVKGFPTGYQTKGIWFGTSYNAEKDEWFVFHYIMP
ncbi:MAG: hypothetical protein RL172_878 [Bacteroidota bacterium]